MSILQSKIYEPTESEEGRAFKTIRFPVRNMLYMRAMIDGTITSTALYLASPVTPLNFGDPPGEGIFNVRVNGDPIFSEIERPQIDNGEDRIEIEDLDFPIEKYDVILLDLEEVIGRLGKSVTWVVGIE